MYIYTHTGGIHPYGEKRDETREKIDDGPRERERERRKAPERASARLNPEIHINQEHITPRQINEPPPVRSLAPTLSFHPLSPARAPALISTTGKLFPLSWPWPAKQSRQNEKKSKEEKRRQKLVHSASLALKVLG